MNFDLSKQLELFFGKLTSLANRPGLIPAVFGLVFFANVIISLIPAKFIASNPFQNLFLIDSKSYLCEAWRRAGLSIQAQNFALDQIGRVYGGEGMTCDYLINSQYPGAPIFSRLLFITPIQVASLIQPIWGPLFLHFVFLGVFFFSALRIVGFASPQIKFAILLFFSNPSIVYPIFAFSTEKYQLLLITYLLVLISSSGRSKKRTQAKFYIAISSLMLLRENFVWGLFFCFCVFFTKRGGYSALRVIPTASLSLFFSIIQSTFSRLNTPRDLTAYGGDRDFTEFQAAKRLFSHEAADLLNKSFCADLRVLFANFTIFDLLTILSLTFVILEYVKRRDLIFSFLGLFLLSLGLAMDMFSAAFFNGDNVVTFFRLLLPSYWAILILFALNREACWMISKKRPDRSS